MKRIFIIFVFFPVNAVIWFFSLFVSGYGLGRAYDIYTTRKYSEEFEIKFIYFEKLGSSSSKGATSTRFFYYGHLGRTEYKHFVKLDFYSPEIILYQIPKQVWVRDKGKERYQIFEKKDNGLTFEPENVVKWSHTYTLSYLVLYISSFLFRFFYKRIKS